MKFLTLFGAVLFALCGQAAPVLAQSIEEKDVVSGKFVFDPQSGYIYLHGPVRQMGMFLKEPDQADIDAYKKDWEEAFAKAKTKYTRQLASWESEKKAAASTPGTRVSAKPVEPTAETFTIGDIETRNSISFGPQYVFRKDSEKPYFSYLNKVKPGTYIYYGAIMMDPNAGYMGNCYCMGSVKVEVKPGVVTDLGNFLLAGNYQTLPETLPPGVTRTSDGVFLKLGKQQIEVGRFAWGLPDTLKALPSVQGDFHASGKMDNFFGIGIARMPAIPGVLGYQRDTVIDLKAGNAPASAPAASPTQ